jgi:dipeptidyl aminopeptidase/acylaminoacyl peptidase
MRLPTPRFTLFLSLLGRTRSSANLNSMRIKSLYLSAVAAAALLLAPGARAGRPMTIDDLLTAVRVSDPQLSPDGRWVAFVRTATDPVTLKRNADIWLVPSDGSKPPRPLTRHEAIDMTPRFSPDGRSLAFLSARSGSAQVWLMSLEGGEPRKLTDVPGGVEEPLVFAPGGEKIAFVADVHPDCPDEACNRKRFEEAEKGPVKAYHLTRLMFRHWNAWRPDVRHHVFVLDLLLEKAADVTPGDFDTPPHFYEEGGIAFSPDGSRLAVVSNREGNDREAWTTNKDVFLVPVTGGAARKVTANPAADFDPVFTPDGASLVTRSQRRAGFEADRWWLEVWDLKTGEKRTVFSEPDLSVESFVLSRDGKTVYFTAESEGRRDLYEVPLAGGRPKELKRGGDIASVRAGAGFLVFSESTLVSPAELFRLSLEEKGASPSAKLQRWKALTDENAKFLAETTRNAPESFVVKGAGGTPVQSWLLKPPGFDASKKYPVVFMIHGGPQGAWEDGWSYRWCPTLWAAQGWVVVLPNPRGSTGFGQGFVDEISGDWCGKVMTDLTAVFDDVARRPDVDASKMGIAGASYGGYAVDWILTQTNRFKAAVTHDGVFDLASMAGSTDELWFDEWDNGGPSWSAAAKAHVARCSPLNHADRIVTPTFVVTDELDYRVPVTQGLELFTILRRRGVPSEALVFPDEGHFVLKPASSKLWHESVFGWLKKYIGP